MTKYIIRFSIRDYDTHAQVQENCIFLKTMKIV